MGAHRKSLYLPLHVVTNRKLLSNNETLRNHIITTLRSGKKELRRERDSSGEEMLPTYYRNSCIILPLVQKSNCI